MPVVDYLNKTNGVNLARIIVVQFLVEILSRDEVMKTNSVKVRR